jgi:cyclopropane-fatty-acyl-phospholipid synthase
MFQPTENTTIEEEVGCSMTTGVQGVRNQDVLTHVLYPERAKLSLLADYLAPRITQGALTIVEADGSQFDLGQGASSERITLRIHRPELFNRIAQGGSRAFGESYAEGWWDVDNDKLQELFSLLFANGIDRAFQAGPIQRMIQMLQRARLWISPREAARADIHAHYDLGNDFFREMLDPSMAYSCGYARNDGDSLEKMQQQKYERIALKLGLDQGGSLLDIGSGWGGLIMYVAQKFPNVRATGITISEEQYLYAHRQIASAGLRDRVTVRFLDYRDIEGSFDFVVSVGMFEHVGFANYTPFFQKVRELLKPSGRALLHTIGLEEDPTFQQDPWLERYIFPGTRLPRLEELAREARNAQLAVGHVENLRPHYAETLRHWQDNFTKSWERISQLGPKFDQQFFRMWNFYLQLCEACFIDSTVELYQLLMTPRPNWNFPRTFDFGGLSNVTAS